MSYLLLIDTAEPEAWVALVDGDEVLVERQWHNDRLLGTHLLSTIEEMLRENGLKVADLTRIGVCTGPGHYSALRAGIVVASMLAEAVSAQLVGFSPGTTIERLFEVKSAVPTMVIVPKYS